MRAVNLLPPEVTSRSRVPLPSPPVLVGLLGGVVVVLALAAGFVLATKSESSKREELGQRQDELSSLPLPAEEEPAAAQSTLASQHAPRVAAVSTALANRVAWDRVLTRFSRVFPEDVWLRSLDLKSPAPGGAAKAKTEADAPKAPNGVSVEGYTYSHNSVARLLARLALIPELTNVQLQSSAVTELAGRRVVEFTVLADVRRERLSS
jgi:Tfp pilus assembly protein PilN